MADKPTYEELEQRIQALEQAESEHKRAEEKITGLNDLKEYLLGPWSLGKKLKRITDGVVEIFQVDFCRIWLSFPGDRCNDGCIHTIETEELHVCRHRERCLHLIASSGRYTHIDGEMHRRVPFDCYKIGRVASGAEPQFLTNDVTHDPRVHNHNWADALGLVSFAGYRLITDTGEPIGVLALFSKHALSPDEDGLLKGLVSAVAQMIQTNKIEEALKESEKKYKMLFQNTDMPITFWDAEMRLLLTNISGAKNLGNTPKEIVGKTIHEILPDISEKAVQRFKSIFKSGVGNEFEDLIEMPTGIGSWYKSNMQPVKDVNGKTIAIQVIAQDATKQKQAEEEKRRMKNQLQQARKMEAIGTLAGGIAHDFNNMLSIILGNTELAMDDVPEWNPARHNLEEIKTASLRSKEIVKQLLSFSKKSDPKQKPVNISPIIKDCLKFLRSSIPANIKIHRTIPDKSGIISADPTQIHQVMLNICTNAAQAMSENGGIMDVSLSSVEIGKDETIQNIELNQGQYVKITVSDTGYGIAKEHLDRVFDPYFTTREVGEGSGIGLSVVHGIVKSHDGAISVDSEYGKGTTFNVFLPVVEKEPALEEETDTTIPKGNERILFVDDETSIVDMTSQTLERLGYTVTAKTSSTDALETFRTRPDNFDLIISDMTMPEITGDKLAKELQKIHPEIPIILCTGHSERIDDEKAKSIGVRALVMKPIVKSVLAKTIRKILD